MVGSWERRKDVAQVVVESGAQVVGRITGIVTGAVRDIAREVGTLATDAFEMNEAAKRARKDDPAPAPE